jgi:hypothetical protein
LGGKSFTLERDGFGKFAESTLIMGADVSHSAPGSIEPSIAAVVGNLDPQAASYATEIQLQIGLPSICWLGRGRSSWKPQLAWRRSQEWPRWSKISFSSVQMLHPASNCR